MDTKPIFWSFGKLLLINNVFMDPSFLEISDQFSLAFVSAIEQSSNEHGYWKTFMRGGSISRNVCGGKPIDPRVIIIAEIDRMEVVVTLGKNLAQKIYLSAKLEIWSWKSWKLMKSLIFMTKSDFPDFDIPEPCKNKAEFSFSRSEWFYEKNRILTKLLCFDNEKLKFSLKSFFP